MGRGRQKSVGVAIRVVLVDDHGVVRAGLRMYLQADPDIEIVGEAGNGREAVELALALRPDVILMDIAMPEMDGLQATAEIRRRVPETEVVALTSILDEKTVVSAVKAGAIGYLLKNAGVADLARAIKNAAAGRVDLAPQALPFLRRELRQPSPPESLSKRESEVLSLIADGKSNREIADALTLSVTTVKTHVANVLAKLELSSRTQAAVYALNRGLS